MYALGLNPLPIHILCHFSLTYPVTNFPSSLNQFISMKTRYYFMISVTLFKQALFLPCSFLATVHLSAPFIAKFPITSIWHFSPCYPSPTPYPLLSLPHSPATDTSVWCSPPCVHVFSLFNTRLWVRTCGVFLFLCQFAENDGFQIHPCPYKWHELIVFYGCIIFHGVYVPHFPCPVYHR